MDSSLDEEYMDDLNDTKDDVDQLMRELYGDDFDEDEEDESDSPPGSWATTERHNILFRETFDYSDDTGGISSRLIIAPRDIRRLQRFAHLTTMNTMTASAMASEMYKLTDHQNQVTDMNFLDWTDSFVEQFLNLPGEKVWVKDILEEMFSVLDRDDVHAIELSDIVTGLIMFTPGSIDKFRLAFQLYGPLKLLN